MYYVGYHSHTNIRLRSHSSSHLTNTYIKRTPGYAGPDEPGYRHESIKRKQRGVCVAESHLEMIGLWGSFLRKPYLHVWCRRNLPNIIINRELSGQSTKQPTPGQKSSGKRCRQFLSLEPELQHWIPNHEGNYKGYALIGNAAFNGPDSTWINWVKSPPISITRFSTLRRSRAPLDEQTNIHGPNGLFSVNRTTKQIIALRYVRY